MDKSYKRAIELLNRSRRRGRPSTRPANGLPGLAPAPNLNGESDLRGTPSIFGMRQWLDQLGHSAADINKLNIIHVAGTKGKGSTCAFIDSFLRVHGRRTGFPRKTGLYTSPHLICTEERVRINFEPLPKDIFAKYFFEVHDVLSEQHTPNLDIGPRYLQLCTLISLHAFIREGVDAAIFETHHGGEYDSTNIFEKPVITAITPLGMDHVKQLGPSIENIAWHKAGIFKPGAPAFSAPQQAAASQVLRNRASNKGVSLRFVSIDPSLPDHALQLKPEVQRTNCSVALAAVRSFLDQSAPKNCSHLSSSDIHEGISNFSWPGRFQLVVENKFQWYLDGAHNEMSIAKAAEWFLEISEMQRITSSAVRILIFSQISDQRDSAEVFKRLVASLGIGRMKYVIFATYERGDDFDPSIDRPPKTLETPLLNLYSEIWKKTQPNTNVLFAPTIQRALEIAREIGDEYDGMQTLITGSLRLIGSTLYLLKHHVFAPEHVQ